MSHAIVKFDEVVVGEDGARYAAQVCGREASDGRWEGWLEFQRLGAPAEEPGAFDAPATDVETVQPNRRDLEYWVTGLSLVYLEGALARALRRAAKQSPESSDAFPAHGPSERQVRLTPVPEPGPAAAPRMRAILDPFAVYVQGEGVLRAELGALATDHLRNVAAAFNIASPETAATLSDRELVEHIVAAARGRVTGPHEGTLHA